METSVGHAVPALFGRRINHTLTTERRSDALEDRVLGLRLPDGSEYRLERPLTIGQSSSNDVVLRDPKVSRRHCVVTPEGNRARIRDLGSTNGTHVNGARVGEAELTVGATLLLGDCLVSLVDLGQTKSLRALLIGESSPMIHLRREIERVAPNQLAVLVRGETGTGKELIAEAVHRLSGRTGAFIAVNCATLPRELIESELFGHEKGAFTGAEQKRIGLFQAAHGGTLFLDEIGELPLEQQSRLLRALESKRIRPVGATKEIPIDVRIVSATLGALPADKFRSDLFYRINGCELRSPPLRERLDDVPALAEHFLRALFPDRRYRLTAGALDRLRHHAWPGNVRELRNALERAAAFAGGLEIGADALNLPQLGATPYTTQTIADVEKHTIASALARCGGNRRQAAKELAMPKSTLCDKVKKYGLDG